MLSFVLTVYILMWCVIALCVMIFIGIAGVRELRDGKESV